MCSEGSTAKNDAKDVRNLNHIAVLKLTAPIFGIDLPRKQVYQMSMTAKREG